MNERCSSHGLVRCAMCDRPAKMEVQALINNVPIPSELLDDPSVGASVENELIIEPYICIEDAARKRHARAVSPSENPIVDAASQYSAAQARVGESVRRIERFEMELKNAKDAYAEAVADRDMKKQVLQKLVAE